MRAARVLRHGSFSIIHIFRTLRHVCTNQCREFTTTPVFKQSRNSRLPDARRSVDSHTAIAIVCHDAPWRNEAGTLLAVVEMTVASKASLSAACTASDPCALLVSLAAKEAASARQKGSPVPFGALANNWARASLADCGSISSRALISGKSAAWGSASGCPCS